MPRPPGRGRQAGVEAAREAAVADASLDGCRRTRAGEPLPSLEHAGEGPDQAERDRAAFEDSEWVRPAVASARDCELVYRHRAEALAGVWSDSLLARAFAG